MGPEGFEPSPQGYFLFFERPKPCRLSITARVLYLQRTLLKKELVNKQLKVAQAIFERISRRIFFGSVFILLRCMTSTTSLSMLLRTPDCIASRSDVFSFTTSLTISSKFFSFGMLFNSRSTLVYCLAVFKSCIFYFFTTGRRSNTTRKGKDNRRFSWNFPSARKQRSHLRASSYKTCQKNSWRGHRAAITV